MKTSVPIAWAAPAGRGTLFTRAAGTLSAAVCCAVAGLAQAAAVPFTATVAGTSSIVEVVNPVGPVVRVETQASGDGSPGLLSYFSGDVINLATGQGSGSNRFVTASGDELLGTFTVQMVPGADASLFDLIGDMVIQGGSGVFQGATGSAAFLGSGQFFSASQANTRFVFQGTLSTVPEPSTAALVVLAALVALTSGGPLARRRQRGPRRSTGMAGNGLRTLSARGSNPSKAAL